MNIIESKDYTNAKYVTSELNEITKNKYNAKSTFSLKRNPKKKKNIS